MAKPDYDTTIARIAGNLLAGMTRDPRGHGDSAAVIWAVMTARMIVAEVKRTEAPQDAAP